MKTRYAAALLAASVTGGALAAAIALGGPGDLPPMAGINDPFRDVDVSDLPAATLGDFSCGGGFVLHFAGSARQALFANYLLLSPFLGHDAPTDRAASGGRLSVGLPRIVALSVLNGVGVHAFDRLPVLGFALADNAKPWLTPQYSFTRGRRGRRGVPTPSASPRSSPMPTSRCPSHWCPASRTSRSRWTRQRCGPPSRPSSARCPPHHRSPEPPR